MKKIILLAVLIPLLGFSSCIKQNNCDCGLKGKFIYYDTPQEFTRCGSQDKYNAFFISDDELVHCRVFGNIPKEFQSKDTLYVRVCFNHVPYGIYLWDSDDCRQYKLKCIENY